MVKLAPGEMSKIAPLFFGVEETMVWSCLQGMMGEGWADR
ncbi:MAG: GNAT family N-acetyltransferase, partial [Oscillospiraceae bacterium]|nr:GNAT family N-acetyltransferase [Oscillospiraceae bacterium]